MSLRLHECRKQGVLLLDKRAVKVSVLHLNKKGDALVHDGRRILMVPKACLCAGDPDSSRRQQEADAGEVVDMTLSEGKRRLALVRNVYQQLTKGELNTGVVLRLCQRYGLL